MPYFATGSVFFKFLVWGWSNIGRITVKRRSMLTDNSRSKKQASTETRLENVTYMTLDVVGYHFHCVIVSVEWIHACLNSKRFKTGLCESVCTDHAFDVFLESTRWFLRHRAGSVRIAPACFTLRVVVHTRCTNPHSVQTLLQLTDCTYKKKSLWLHTS